MPRRTEWWARVFERRGNAGPVAERKIREVD